MVKKTVDKSIAFLSHVDMNLYLFRLPIMKRLIETGWEVSAIVPDGEYSEKFSTYGIKHIPYYIKRKSLNICSALCTIKALIFVLKNSKPQILHTFTIKPNLFGVIAGRLSGIPVIINTVTGMGALSVASDFKSKILKQIMLLCYKYSLFLVDAVIFQNEDDRDFFIQKKIVSRHKTCLVKGSGINVKEWMKERGIEKKIYDKKIKVIMIARLIVQKGVGEYIQAARKLHEKYKDQVEFLLVGDYYDGSPYNIPVNLVYNAKDEGIITHLGWRNDIRELLGTSDIFVLPSYYGEGIPRTAIEAASMGLPIITTDHVGCREVVDDGKNGFLISPKSVNELVVALEKMILNNELRDRMGKLSRKKAIKEFDVDVVINKYLELYKILNAKTNVK